MAVITCDAPRCNARALTRWVHLRDDLTDPELRYCGHHSDRIGPRMMQRDERWVQVDDERDTWPTRVEVLEVAP